MAFYHQIKNITDYLIYELLSSRLLLLPVSDFSGVIDICSEKTELKTHCLKIAETLINNSDTLVSTIAGHQIKTDVLKKAVKNKTEKNKILTKALQQQAIYKGQYECLNNAISNPNALNHTFDLNVLKHRLSWMKEEGELASMIKMARFIYAERIKKNGQSVFITDPEMCIR